MKKKTVFIICLIFCLVIVLALAIFMPHSIDKKDLVGEMIFGDVLSVDSDATESYLVGYSPATGTLKKLASEPCGQVFYNKEKSKILCEKYGKDYSFTLYEYDVLSKETLKIVDSAHLLFENEIGCYRYIPNSNNISYIADDKIYAYDRVSATNTCIMNYECSYTYSWDNTGKKITYADYSGNIYIYDILTKKNNQILKGYDPQFSNNGKYIAYCNKDRKVMVYDLETKEEWKSLSTGGVQQFVFSPDDKYLAAEIQYTDILNNPYFKMYVIDFRAGKHICLFKGDDGIPSFDWK